MKTKYHHGDLKNSLLEAAAKLLKKNGLHKLSVREIAKSAGVSAAAPYRHFKDKTAIIEALAEQGFQQLSQFCEEAQNKLPNDAKAQLLDMGLSYVIYAVENREIMQLMLGGAINYHQCSTSLSKTAELAIMNLMQIIQNGQDQGIYKERSNYELSLAAWSIAHGLSLLASTQILALTIKTKKDLEQASIAVGNLLLEGMLK